MSSTPSHDACLDSSSSSSTHSDDALKLFASAPWWLYCTSWKLAKPENVGTESCAFKVTGPVTCDEMMQLYRTKRLKGSVLMAGLTHAAKDMRPLQELPANVYRTLAHLFEMSRNGVPYTPVDCEGVRVGMPAASWARPLWTICEPSLPSRPSLRQRANGLHQRNGDGAGQSQGTDGGASKADEDSSEEAEEDGADALSDSRRCTFDEETSLAVKLLRSAPAWCYLYSHEPLKSKKTPPKTSDHMVDMYKSGCLPEWTPLLGLRQDVAHFNSLPPSLFTTLGALLTILQAGLELQPVGLVELQRYDKFIECRNHVGSTMRVPSTTDLQKIAASTGSQSFNRRAVANRPSVDGLTRALSGLAPVGNGKAAAAASGAGAGTSAGSANTAVSGASSVSGLDSTAGAHQVPQPNHGMLTPDGNTTASVESRSPPAMTPPAMPYHPDPISVTSPCAMQMQPHMHMYQAMLPTWMWGMPHVPHMPYTLIASPPGAAQPQAVHAVTSPPARRSNQGKQRNSTTGSRMGASIPSSPAGIPPAILGAAPASMQMAGSVPNPSGNSHRLSHSSGFPAIGHFGSGGVRMSSSGMLLGSPTSPVVPGVPASPHHMWMPGHPGMMPADAAAAAAMQAGMWAWPTSPAAPPHVASAAGAAAPGWSTAVFRLFMADSSRGMGIPAWWYLDHRTPGGLVGPLGCEPMIMAYARGELTEQHLVCGTHGDVTAACPPAREFFEELGGLLGQVEAGGQYKLVSSAEVTQHASQASNAGSMGGTSTGGRPNGSSGGRGSARKGSKGGSSGSAGSGSNGTLNSLGSAPVAPRTPTSATSPRQDETAPTHADERWDPNGLPNRSAPGARTPKSGPRISAGQAQRTPTSSAPAGRVDRGRVLQAGEEGQHDTPSPSQPSSSAVGASGTSSGVRTQRMSMGNSSSGASRRASAVASAFSQGGSAAPVASQGENGPAAAAPQPEGGPPTAPLTAITGSGSSWEEPQDSAFATHTAAAAAAAVTASPEPAATADHGQQDDSRSGALGLSLGSGDSGRSNGGALPQYQGSGGLVMSESGRLVGCMGMRDQSRKSSRAGAGPLSAKNSVEEDQTRVLNNVCGNDMIAVVLDASDGDNGQLRDSDDDVRGPAARDAHESRSCSCGGLSAETSATALNGAAAVVQSEL